MMMKAWMPSSVVSPTARSLSNSRSAVRAMRRPVPTINTKAMRTNDPPRRPSSSPIAAKMKSVSAAGINPGWPRPGPLPVTPPAASENQPWITWKPLPDGSSHGFSQIVTRVCTWSNVRHAKNAPAENRTVPRAR